MTIAVTIAADCGAPAADGARDRAARERARTPPAASSSRLPRATTSTSAPLLTRADERRPAPRERALVVRHAGIEIARRPAQLHGHPHAAAGAPLVDAIGGERADDGDAARRRATALVAPSVRDWPSGASRPATHRRRR